MRAALTQLGLSDDSVQQVNDPDDHEFSIRVPLSSYSSPVLAPVPSGPFPDEGSSKELQMANPDVINPHRRSAAESLASIKGSVGEIKESVGEMVQAEREHLQETYERGKERMRTAKSGFEDYVREKPVQSLLIAAGAGALLGYILGRRR